MSKSEHWTEVPATPRMEVTMIVRLIGRNGLRISGCALLLVSALLVGSHAAFAFECPIPQKTAQVGVLKESPEQIRNMSELLASDDANNHILSIVSDLRKRYPNVQNAELFNYLATAYCPVVARLSGLSDREQQERVIAFDSRTRKIIYTEAQK